MSACCQQVDFVDERMNDGKSIKEIVDDVSRSFICFYFLFLCMAAFAVSFWRRALSCCVLVADWRGLLL